MWGSAARKHRQAPWRSTSITAFHASSSRFSRLTFLAMPALATTMCMPPSSLVASAISASTSALFVTSTAATTTRRPALSTASRMGSMSWPSGGYQASATSAPASANIFAVAAPMPDAAPVISATRPFRSNMVALQWTSQHHVPAIGTERLPYVVRAVGGSQQHCGRSDLVDGSEPADWQLRQLGASPFLRLTVEQGGINGTRGNGVHEHTSRRDLACKGFGECDDAALARGIVRDRSPADLAQLRRDVDDPPVATLEHLVDQRARTQERSTQIGVDDSIPVVDGHLLE